MNPAELFYRRNESYYKYRFIKPYPTNYGTIEESWGMKGQSVKYLDTGDYGLRAYNLEANFEDHKVSYFEAKDIWDNPYEFYDKHIAIIPVQLSAFFENQDFTPSGVFDTSDIIIVSAPPKRTIVTTLSFLAIDPQILIFICGMVVTVSAMIMLRSMFFTHPKRNSSNIISRLFSELANNIWSNASLLCMEPIRRISPELAPRLFTSSWMIGVTFILIFLGCYLKTEFSIETYDCIDTLSDLIASKKEPLIIETGAAHAFFKKMITQNTDPIVKQWLSKYFLGDRSFCSLLDLLAPEGYDEIISGKKALIIGRMYFKFILGEVLTKEPAAKERIAALGGLYISKEDIYMDYMHIIYNKTFVESSPVLKELPSTAMYPFFECKSFAYLDLEFNYDIDYITWMKPKDSATDLSLFDMTPPFYVLLPCLLICCVVLVLEEILQFIELHYQRKRGNLGGLRQ